MAPYANKINDKRRSQKNYSLWECEKDLSELKIIAVTYGIEDTSYAGNLLIYDAGSMPRGTLLWTYKGESGYMWQWVTINVVCAFFTLLLVFLVRKSESRIVRSVAILSSPSVLTALNMWVFFGKPESMDIRYWIIPGLLFVVCWLIMVWSDVHSSYLGLRKHK